MTKLTKSLKADLPALAELLRSKGKNNDSILAHINPREAALLKRHGGSGDINPDTGLPQFDDGDATLTEIGVSPEQQNAPLPSDQTAFNQAQQYFDSTPSTTAQSNQAQGLVDTGGKPSGLGDYSLASGVPTVGLGQTGVAGGTGQGLADTGVSPLYTGAIQTGQELANLPYSSALGPTSQTALSQATTQGPTPSTLGNIGGALGNVSSTTLLKALGLGGLGLLGARNANVAGAQNQAATAQQQAIAQPYQAQGQEMIGAAQRGELTPQSQQAYQAAMAQANQAMANRGGVGQAQMQQQMANLYNQLLQNQYTYGLQVAQIGDNIALGAIRSGLQLDKSLQQTTQNFYTQLAAIASGSVIGGTKQGVA